MLHSSEKADHIIYLANQSDYPRVGMSISQIPSLLIHVGVVIGSGYLLEMGHLLKMVQRGKCISKSGRHMDSIFFLVLSLTACKT